MGAHRRSAARPPLDHDTLNGLALAYVGRFATTRSKLRQYLRRKIRERGWAGTAPADVEALAERFSESGYIDDGAYARAKSEALAGRGYGRRRVDQALRAAGVAEADTLMVRERADETAIETALRFARRRRIGPFAAELPDMKVREKALAAMLRAGHDFQVARAIVDLAPTNVVDVEELTAQLSLILH